MSEGSYQPRPTAVPIEVIPESPRATGPLHVVLQQRGVLGKWGGRLPWIIAGICFLLMLSAMGSYHSYFQTNPELQEKYYGLAKEARDKIAIIEVEGAIMKADGFIKSQIDQVKNDPHVKAVVLRVDSPGGTVTGSDAVYHQLRKVMEERKLPLVVSMGGLAASGGYYIAMAVGDTPDSIYAEPATWTGSIGVIIPHYNVADLLSRWDIQDDSIASAPMKQMGSPTKKFTGPELERERAILRSLVMESFEEFKDVVRAGRPKLRNDKALLEQATTGQIFNAKQAQKIGLVDKLGYLDDAVNRAAELAKLDVKKVRAVKYKQNRGLLDDVLAGSSASAQSRQLAQLSQVASLLELATPRAYYLFSGLPSLVSSAPR